MRQKWVCCITARTGSQLKLLKIQDYYPVCQLRKHEIEKLWRGKLNKEHYVSLTMNILGLHIWFLLQNCKIAVIFLFVYLCC